MRDCRQLLDQDSRFLFLTVYAVRMSSLALAGLLEEVFADLPGKIEHGDLAVRELPVEVGAGGRVEDSAKPRRILPTAIFARWSNPV
jgi:23S rRNA (cytosine1962-C5)-methyltransferase